MKRTIQLLFIGLVAFGQMATAQTKSPVWNELKNFHTYMAATFHPAEEGNFAPLRAKADSLLAVVKIWQSSPVPANYKPAETKAALSKLTFQCTAISKAVRNAAGNDSLKKMITDAHDIFHTIVGECRKTDE
jgi:hypothetical protein